jgi:hypothetical protein
MSKSEPPKATRSDANLTAVKRDAEKLEKVVNRNSKEYVDLIRQIWKEGREREAHSVTEARRRNEKKTKTKVPKAH